MHTLAVKYASILLIKTAGLWHAFFLFIYLRFIYQLSLKLVFFYQEHSKQLKGLKFGFLATVHVAAYLMLSALLKWTASSSGSVLSKCQGGFSVEELDFFLVLVILPRLGLV